MFNLSGIVGMFYSFFCGGISLTRAGIPKCWEFSLRWDQMLFLGSSSALPGFRSMNVLLFDLLNKN